MKTIAILMLAVMFVSGVAFAESISGKVSAVDPATKVIKVATMDAAGAETEISVAAQDTTAYQGIADLAGLQVGAKVDINAAKDEATGSLKAETIAVAAEY